MKLFLCAAPLASLPPAAQAELAGDWAGVITFPQQPLHFVLHISGPDSSLKATHDSPDQNGVWDAGFINYVLRRHSAVLDSASRCRVFVQRAFRRFGNRTSKRIFSGLPTNLLNGED